MRSEPTPLQRSIQGLDERLTRGVVAGIAAGLVFLLLNMGWATKSDLPGVAPLIDIATIFNVTDTPDPTPENLAIGLVTHLTLSMFFGLGFAVILPWLGTVRSLTLGAVGFGVGLYILNFQVLGRTAFPWFQERPDQTFELAAHALFGLMLVPFFLGLRGQQPLTAART